MPVGGGSPSKDGWMAPSSIFQMLPVDLTVSTMSLQQNKLDVTRMKELCN